MKKFVAVLSAAAMMTTLAACGATAEPTASSSASATAEATSGEGYKIAEVAELTGKSEAAVAKTLSRGRAMLRTMLGGEF